jgi:phospholipid/cholesterol/gamma-HCH transport system permease protein
MSMPTESIPPALTPPTGTARRTDPRHGDGILHAFFERAGLLASFTGRFLAEFWRPPFENRELLRQMDEVGSKSFLLVFVTGLSTGIVLSMQSRGTLTYFGAEAMLPDLVALSVIKEFGPVFTAVVLAGRLGAGFVAEVGSMRVTEQIDAMEVAALQPFRFSWSRASGVHSHVPPAYHRHRCRRHQRRLP